MASLFLLLLVFTIGSPIAMSSWLLHSVTCLFALSQAGKLAKYPIFWLLLILTYFFATEARLSIEYLLIAGACFIFGSSKSWVNLDKSQRATRLLIVFIALIIANFIKYTFSELGSLLLWLPVMLAINFKNEKLNNTILNFLGPFILIFLNKKTTVLAALANFANYKKSKILYLVGGLAFASSFFFLESWRHFYNTSFYPRILIWQGAFKGFLAKPLTGHGFGTFTLDFPIFRELGNVLGSHANQQVNHGHNLFAHMSFELGIVGILLGLSLFYLVFKREKQALIPLLIICLADSPLQAFNQFIIAGLILLPLCFERSNIDKTLPKFNPVFKSFYSKLPQPFSFIAALVLFGIMLYSFIPSCIGHYFYDHKEINQAIYWDAKHPLYYLVRGADRINDDTENSEVNFKKAVELAPNVPYFYGFLASAQLANFKLVEAKESIDYALKYTGEDAYWLLISAILNKEKNETLSKEQYEKAIELEPKLAKILTNPDLPSFRFIGSRKGDPRINAFYRTGKRLYVPLPYIEVNHTN
ncbi:MAG: O-antigen ligase family protein [Candidatus Caenarcaniphilales bacterium]|nr:O-antigen ligase family protein [Candidatus Caenarcaniphilales bacterium]